MLLSIPNKTDITSLIKVNEMETNHRGRFFISRQNGVLKTVKLTVENDMLVVDGRELLDMTSIEILLLR